MCCQHFEDHPSHITQTVNLKVKTEFASLYYLSRSTRPPPTSRTPLPHIPHEPTKKELQSRLVCLQKKNQYLKDENNWLKQCLSDAEDEVVYLRTLLSDQHQCESQSQPLILPPLQSIIES